MAPGSSPGRRTHAPLEERDNSPGPHPGDCRFEPGTEHGPIVYRLGSGTFISGDRVRLPVGLLRGSQVRYGAGLITQRCAGSNPVPATKCTFRCRLMAGPVAVTHVIGVRLPAPEPWRLSTTGQCAAPSRRRVRVRVPQASPDPLSSAEERPPDAREAGGSAPPAGTTPRWRNG
jgi:hypothetical protein